MEGTMPNRRSFLLIAAASLCCVPLFAAPVPVRISADSETHVSDVSDVATQKAELHRSLVARESAKGLANKLEVKLTPEERTAAEAREDEGRLRVGMEKSVTAVVKLVRSPLFGDVADVDGSVLWTGRLTAPGASGIRLHLSPFDLPESAELYVYAADGQVYGPYTGRGPVDDGELWTNTILGDEVRLQLSVAPEDAARTRLVVAGIGYMGTGLPMAGSNLCADNASCVYNAACPQVSSVVNPARDAVASILFASGGFYYICTGGMIADGNSTHLPYFLTANHCISRSREASSMETYFDYESGSCSTPNCTQPYNTSGDTVGSAIVASNRTGDYTLLQLSWTPGTKDGVVTYLGWTATAVANTNGAHLYRLSHPSGAPQAYSQHDVDTSKPTCNSWPRGSWVYSRDITGATEGGSSGSPVLNGSGQIVGQLSGGCGFNVNDVCDATSNATVDGAFASYYGQVSSILGGGGPSCSDAGASCSMDSECCSNSCKGKPGAKKCK
jgi:V8-like Glu-specific endopeptidase